MQIQLPAYITARRQWPRNCLKKSNTRKCQDGYTESPDGKPFGGDAVKLAEVIPQPIKRIISRGEMQAIIETGLHWTPRKYDGETAKKKITVDDDRFTLLCEFMRAPHQRAFLHLLRP